MRCNNCGAELQDNAKFCTSCGSKVENVGPQAGPKHCPNCGSQLAGDASFCTNCGQRVGGPVRQAAPRNNYIR
ncbi:MAG: zinc-ribbon domain-containing protein, partial [Ezakiella massiliensis]